MLICASIKQRCTYAGVLYWGRQGQACCPHSTHTVLCSALAAGAALVSHPCFDSCQAVLAQHQLCSPSQQAGRGQEDGEGTSPGHWSKLIEGILHIKWCHTQHEELGKGNGHNTYWGPAFQGVAKHCLLLREAVDFPSPEVSKARRDGTLSKLIWWCLI